MRYQRLQLGGSLVLFSLDGKEKERPDNNFRGSRSKVLAEKDSSAQGHARGRRVCSFIGVGFPWPLRSPILVTEGESQEGAGAGEGAAGPVPMREEIEEG